MAYAAPEPIAVPYATWFQRVGAAVIDAVIPAIIYIIGFVTRTGLLILLFVLIAIAVQGYNRWFLAGRTGQSWGKKAMGLRLISETTGEPIGAGMAFVRDIVHFLDGLFCYIGYLWPLWDPKRQTFADKILHTIVVPA